MIYFMVIHIDLIYKDSVATQSIDCTEPQPVTRFIGHAIPKEFIKLAGLDEKTAENSSIRPIYDLGENNLVQGKY